MGEPLANYAATVKSLRILTDPRGFGLSPRRITVSTVGLAAGIEKLAKEDLRVNLAISLHATTNETRDRLMPVNRGFPIEALLAACKRFPLPMRQRMTFEYVLLDGVNDSPQDAKRLLKLLKGLRAKVNLIPFNDWESSGLRAAADGAHPVLPGHPAGERDHRHRALEQGRGHRRRLRPAQRAGGGVSLPVTVAFPTLGCRLNQVDSQEMAALWRRGGSAPWPPRLPPQVYVVNTCTVTGKRRPV